MARTLYGNLTGRAASLDLADQRSYIVDLQLRMQHTQTEETRKLRMAEYEAMSECADIEGFDSFESWWESAQVPAVGSFTIRLKLLHHRIRRLRLYDTE